MRIIPANWLDECADLAVTPAAVTAFPITNLQLTKRDRLWRSPNLDPQTITGTFAGGPRPVNAWAIFPGDGNLVGAKVRVVLSAAGATVYDSGTLDAFTFSGTGWGSFPWGGHPWGVETADRSFRRAPLARYITEVYPDSFSVTITNGGAMDEPAFEADRLTFGQSVLAPYTARTGLAPVTMDPSEHQRSPGAVLRVREVAGFREVTFDTVFESEADRFAWSEIMGYIGVRREIVLSLLPDDATTKGRDLTYRGYLKAVNPLAFTDSNFHTLQLSLTES